MPPPPWSSPWPTARRVPGTVPDAPKAGQSTYLSGDRLLVTLPDPPAGKDSYAAVSLPDGRFYSLTDVNTIVPFDNQAFASWAGGTTALDLTVPDGFPKGDYTVWLLRMPAGTNPVGNTDKWDLGRVTFEIN